MVVCDDGWAADPIMIVSCTMPSTLTAVCCALNLVLSAFNMFATMRLLWHWWHLGQHVLPLFKTYVIWACADCLMIVAPFAVLMTPGAAFGHEIIACIFLAQMLWCLGYQGQ